MHMTSPATQNKAHRTDAEWTKTKGNDFRINGQRYVSEYNNTATGWTIRKHYGTGLRDGRWYIFDQNGATIDTAHSLTWAKGWAAYRLNPAA